MQRVKGQSLVMWTIVFAVVTAAFFLSTPALKRILQDREMAIADYVIWTAWHNVTSQYKGDINVHAKTVSNQGQRSALRELKNSTIEIYGKGEGQEHSVLASTDYGSEAILETVDLNNMTR